jgi:glutathione S-transferase
MLARLPILEGQLAKTRCFGGDHWDLSDFMMASVLFTLSMIKYELGKFPALQAWLAASVARPAASEAIKLRG